MSIQQLAAIEFPAYGSLYFADTTLPFTQMLPFILGFCIGPHCGARYWDCNVGKVRYYDSRKPNRGPCEFYRSEVHIRSADIPAQGLSLVLIATASLIMVFPVFRLTILRMLRNHLFMDP